MAATTMASGAQQAVMVAMGRMLAILLIAVAVADADPAQGTCSAEYNHAAVDVDPPFKTSPACSDPVEYELYARLYLWQNHFGPDRNEEMVLRPHLDTEFGQFIVNDWSITSGPTPDSKVVAHAKGLHIKAGMRSRDFYYYSFNMVLEDPRFKGSTLQVQGTNIYDGEWAIVGGTGQFVLARGVIYKSFSYYETHAIKLDLRVFYTPTGGSKGAVWTLEA